MEETQWFTSQATLADAIARAAMAENHCGKRYRHQCRIPRKILRVSFQKLCRKEDAIRACESFDELHNLIKLTLKDIAGIGELYCYDTALRIGAKLNLHPQTVLLHAGTRRGASFVTDIRGRKSLSRDDLPLQLRQLPLEQVEDILCIYKDRIKEMHNQSVHRITDKSGSR
jgi:hypothetical protein